MTPHYPPAVPANYPTYPTYPSAPQRFEVTVTDIRMPFGSMVVFIIKWTIASIPALLILGVLTALFWGVLAGVIGGLIGFGRFR